MVIVGNRTFHSLFSVTKISNQVFTVWKLGTNHNEQEFEVRSANAGRASIQSAAERDPRLPIRFNLLNALESGFHGHSGSGDIALHVSEQIARLVPLINGEFSRG
jgi:hypothetical protein